MSNEHCTICKKQLHGRYYVRFRGTRKFFYCPKHYKELIRKEK